MHTRTLFAGLILTALLLSCSSKPKQKYDLDQVVITMKRTYCYGMCPVYSLTIYGNGTVVYEGVDHVQVKGKQTLQIPQKQVRQLVDQFFSIDYFSLQDDYKAPVTDLPTTITSISVNGKTKTVRDYYGAPEKLKELEKQIDAVAQAQQWVKGSPESK